MPGDPFKRACVVAGCPNPPHVRGRCQAHARQADELRGLNADRHLGAALYASREWRELRAAVLGVRPLCECVTCLSSGRRERADTVHHIEPHGGKWARFFDPSNLRALSAACHARLHREVDRAIPISTDRSAARPGGRAPRAASGFAKGTQG